MVMPVIRQVKVGCVTEKNVKHATVGEGKYLSRGQWETVNSQKLLALSRRLAYGEDKRGNVILCHSHSDNIMSDGERGWESEFVDTKRQWGKMKGKPYYHFIISPDPKDKVSPEDCLRLAEEWVEENFNGAQWYACVHKAEESHIIHAHVIINSVYPDTGRKIHRTPNDIRHESKSLQRIASERYGMTPLEDIDDYRRRRAAEWAAAHVKDGHSEGS